MLQPLFPPTDSVQDSVPRHHDGMARYPFPPTALIRLAQIIGNPKATPPIPAVLNLSKSTWWAGVKSGRFPKPIKKLGSRITLWRASDIIDYIESGIKEGN